MNPDKSPQNLFNEALERQDASERARFLDDACGADAPLRERVEKLLCAHDEAGGFFSQPSKPPAAAQASGAIALPVTEKPGDRIGRYRLLQQIGEGGCGIVYMAEQEEPVHRRVALKVIKLGMDTKQVIARFDAERQALALMDHANIAKVLDAGATETGRPYFVMELVRGTKITEFCDESKLPTEDRLKLFIQVCHAIQHAHQKGVIHRDVKPSNILVTINDGVPVPKVIDFGIAKATAGRLTDHTLFTAFEQFIGTPAYMSPEQAVMTSLDIDTRSDIYSLGVLLYELLTGSPPFDQKALLAVGLDEMRRIIRETKPPRPSNRLSTMAAAALTTTAHHRHTEPPRLIHLVRGDLDWIVMKCLEKDRARRYETANALAADIRRHLDCEPVVARPPSRWYEFQKTVRRHKFGFAATGAVIITLAIGLGVSTWQFRNADTARQLADQARRDERRLNFQMAFDRGIWLCEQGKVASGMLWLARALELAPPGESDMQRVIRANLNAWQRELHVLTGIYPREQGVVSGEFSPDGTQVLTGGYDGVAQLWDRQTGTVLGDPLRHASEAHTAIFSPDGDYVLTTSTDKTARLWETKSHNLIRTFPHGSAVWAGVFTRDGKIITGNSKGEIQVWERDKEKPIDAWRHSTHGIHDLALSPDGKQVLGAGDDGIVLLWDLQTHKVVARFVGHTDRVPTAVFVATNQIASGDIDGNVFLWTWREGEATVDGERIGKPWKHRGGVHRLRVNEHRDQLLTASYDRTAQLLNSKTGEPIGVAFEHQGALRDVAFGKDGSILTCSEDDAARVWRPAPGCLDAILRHEAGSQHVLFTADAKYALVRPKDRTALIRKALTDEAVGKPPTPGEVGVHAFAVSPDESKVMTTTEDGLVQFWATATGMTWGESFKHSGSAWTVAISPDGKTAVSGGLDGVVKLWDAQAGRPLRTVLAISNAPIRGLAFSPDGSRIVVGAGDKLARVIGTGDWSVTRKLEGHHGSVMTVAFSPDGRRVATGSFDNTVIVWDAETGLPISKPMRHRGPFWYAVAFSKDGRSVVTGCDDATARIWDIATSKPIGPLLPHDAALRTAVFAENDRQIITGTSIGTTYIWNVSRAPLESDVERIVLSLQVSTGMELGNDGEIRPLDPETWRQRSKRLAAFGGTQSK
jgi:eukaryotic-like serine/threonine-protein kinase